jgi:hypothetical protein
MPRVSLLSACAPALLVVTACASGAAPGADEPDGGPPGAPADAEPADAASLAADATDDVGGDAAVDASQAGGTPDAAPDAAVAACGGPLVAPASAGGKVTGSIVLSPAVRARRLTVNSCSGTSLGFSSAVTAYCYVEVRNPSDTDDVVVSAWTSRAPGGPLVDTILAAYDGAAPPASDTARLACRVGVEQGCTSGGDPTACVEEGGRDWAGLMDGDGRGVTIAAGGSVVLYVAAYDEDEAGELRLSVRTEAWP